MSDKMEMRVYNVSELRRKFGRLEEIMQREIHNVMKTEAPTMENMMAERCPVKTGYLKSTVYVKVEGWILKLGATAYYAIYRIPWLPKYIAKLRLPNLINQMNDALGKAIKEASA